MTQENTTKKPCPVCDAWSCSCAKEDEAEQAELIRHNAEFDRWEAMTPRQREDEIRRAM